MAVLRKFDGPASHRNRGLLRSILYGCVFGLALSLVVSHRPSQTQNTALRGSIFSGSSREKSPQESFTDQTIEITILKTKLEEVSSERDSMQRLVAEQRETIRALETKRVDQQKSTSVSGDRHTPWGPSSQREEETNQPELAKLLKSVAINNEVMVAVSNINYARPGGMLDLWMKGTKEAGVKNAMVVALDDETKSNVEAFGLPAWRLDLEIPESQKNSGSNHAVSALKFRILKPFLQLGYSVLLSDVDIVTIQNPFDHLVRDSDVESMSDGWDDGTAYGYNDVKDDPSMGWARYAHSMRIFVFNSGLFYLRPTQAAVDLLEKVISRVETENGWDQALFNECIFFPNSPKNKVKSSKPP
jgi:hypothetical protein